MNILDFLPPTNQEDWKFADFNLESFASNLGNSNAQESTLNLAKHASFCSLSFVDGVLIPDLSNLDELSDILVIQTNATLFRFEDKAKEDVNLFLSDLAKSCAKKNYVIRLIKSFKKPILFRFIHTQNHNAFFELEILADNNIFEEHIFIKDNLDLNYSSSLSVAADLNFVKVNLYDFSAKNFVYKNTIHVEQHAKVEIANCFSDEDHKDNFFRLTQEVYLQGKAIEFYLGVIAKIQNANLLDIYTLINHKKPDINSYQLNKNLVSDSAQVNFCGLIKVDREAQKTNAQLDNKNLVLANTARVNAMPQLEIYADDVKCSHGSTTGQLDSQQLLYLMTRGISKEEAIKMLQRAFIFDKNFLSKNKTARDYAFSKLKF